MLQVGKRAVNLRSNGEQAFAIMQCLSLAGAGSRTSAQRDVMAVLLPIWHDKRETARRVRQRISAIMEMAYCLKVTGATIRLLKPLGRHFLKTVLFAPTSAHFNTQQLELHLPKFENLVHIQEQYLPFEFLTLTACRSGEVRRAVWDEIDFKAAIWTVPAERMKAKREHRVPLSSYSLKVLNEAIQMLADGNHELIFPSPTGKVLSDNTLSKLCRDHNIGCVPHGMRSSFRDWAAECTNVPREKLCEASTSAHRPNSDRVEAAYFGEATMFERSA